MVLATWPRLGHDSSGSNRVDEPLRAGDARGMDQPGAGRIFAALGQRQLWVVQPPGRIQQLPPAAIFLLLLLLPANRGCVRSHGWDKVMLRMGGDLSSGCWGAERRRKQPAPIPNQFPPFQTSSPHCWQGDAPLGSRQVSPWKDAGSPKRRRR